MTEEIKIEIVEETKYIWEKEVKEIKWTKVEFVDGTKDKFTKRQLEYMVTDEAVDPTGQRDMLMRAIVPEFLAILEKHDIKNCDVQPVFDSVRGSYIEALNVAIGKALWTFEEWVHSAYCLDNIRISHIKKFK